MTPSDRIRVAAWLLCCAALVFAMVVVGGITRLTHSGLSMVEWQPLVGAVPPLSQADWQELFLKYQQTPEFRLVNTGMDLQGFKGIFWWEYLHRLLARATGLVFLVPFAWLLARRKLPRRLAWQLALVLALGALQGALGWLMVASGLVDRPRVSHLRLAAHLGMALAILAAELWVALDVLSPGSRARSRPRLEVTLPAIVFAMALTGALVAGLRAGHAFRTFPLMDGALVPAGTLLLEPWWSNFVDNATTVQLVHRALFWTLAAIVPVVWWRQRTLRSANLLLAAFLLQASLGIATLLLGVPVVLAVSHQACAVLVLATALWTAHAASPQQPVFGPRHARAAA